MCVKINFENEYEEDRCVDVVEYWCLYIENGDVSKITYHSTTFTPLCHTPTGEWTSKKGDNTFDEKLLKAFKILSRHKEKKFKMLLEALDQEVIDRYFEKKYVLK